MTSLNPSPLLSKPLSSRKHHSSFNHPQLHQLKTAITKNRRPTASLARPRTALHSPSQRRPRLRASAEQVCRHSPLPSITPAQEEAREAGPGHSAFCRSWISWKRRVDSCLPARKFAEVGIVHQAPPQGFTREPIFPCLVVSESVL